MRLRRSDLARPGFTRRRRGRGISYFDPDGAPVRDPRTLDRLNGLVVPPAWRDVWISPDPRGHIQATGVDAAGRKQYLYHPVWRTKRDEAKFDHALDIAERLPSMRQRLCADMTSRGLSRPRVLATIARLLDMGMFRVGSDQYATGDDPSYGLATLRPEHVRGRRGCVVLEFTGKAGVAHANPVDDAEVCAVLRELRRRRADQDRLFAYWDAAAKQWRDVRSDEVNAYLREVSGAEMTAKDFRTWHGTVRAATELSVAGWQRSEVKRKRIVAGAMREVAELLGNTPTVARASYVDPRVIDLYHDGTVAKVDCDTPREQAETAVLDLLHENT
ncbi:MAG TPA: DNA topoisomerase IB [Actinoplanes sp.]|jgi:DNA topoisomerase IB